MGRPASVFVFFFDILRFHSQGKLRSQPPAGSGLRQQGRVAPVFFFLACGSEDFFF